jgi:hypothetical protein
VSTSSDLLVFTVNQRKCAFYGLYISGLNLKGNYHEKVSIFSEIYYHISFQDHESNGANLSTSEFRTYNILLMMVRKQKYIALKCALIQLCSYQVS